MIKKRFVETILPSSYIYELGVYLQTCSQIEFYASSAICKIEGIAQTDKKSWTARHDELRNMPTSSLITELSKATLRLQPHDPWQTYFKELCGWLHRYVNNRHLAVHGRHYLSHETGFVQVDVAPREQRAQRIFNARPEDTSSAMNDADQILCALIRYCGEE